MVKIRSIGYKLPDLDNKQIRKDLNPHKIATLIPSKQGHSYIVLRKLVALHILHRVTAW